jgi:hypothetical protein
VPNGGLRKDGTWQFPKKGNEKFLFPVKAMQSVYKAVFMKGLDHLIQNKMIDVPPDFSTEKSVYKAWKNELYSKNWVIYAKRPFGGPKQVIEYLGRYTHKVAISNHRIKAADTEGVVFEYKDYKTGGEKKDMRLTTDEFIRRFVQHILPPKFRRMRHYGFLSNASKQKSLEKARKALKVKAQITLDKAARREAARQKLLGQNPDLCPCCKKGKMLRVGILPPSRAPPNAGEELKNALFFD